VYGFIRYRALILAFITNHPIFGAQNSVKAEILPKTGSYIDMKILLVLVSLIVFSDKNPMFLEERIYLGSSG